MANQVVYGFHTLQERFAETAAAVGPEPINEAINQAIAEHNRQLTLLTRLFVRQGETAPKRTFRVGQSMRNQPLDEAGRPLPVRGEARYEVGLPLQMSGNAMGWTFLESVEQRIEDVNRRVAAILDGDASWMFDHILAALFNNANRSYYDEDFGSLTVVPIANGDATVYQVGAGSFAGATDNHLLAQAAAIDDANNPFAAIYTELTEHPENGSGEVISFISSSLRSSVMGLGSFHAPPNPNITPGSGQTVLTGNLGIDVPGTLLGLVDEGPWIVEWPRVPAGYIVSVHTGGERPIAERVKDVARLRGFVNADDNEDFPWYQRNWIRIVGFGGWNRVSAVVTRIGNGTYAIPTNYATIMP